jgi:hypothetical protein
VREEYRCQLAFNSRMRVEWFRKEVGNAPVKTSKVETPPFLPNMISVSSLSPIMIVRAGSKSCLAQEVRQPTTRRHENSLREVRGTLGITNPLLGFDAVHHSFPRFPNR